LKKKNTTALYRYQAPYLRKVFEEVQIQHRSKVPAANKFSLTFFVKTYLEKKEKKLTNIDPQDVIDQFSFWLTALANMGFKKIKTGTEKYTKNTHQGTKRYISLAHDNTI
jgi:hypothetical protein